MNNSLSILVKGVISLNDLEQNSKHSRHYKCLLKIASVAGPDFCRKEYLFCSAGGVFFLKTVGSAHQPDGKSFGHQENWLGDAAN